MANYLNRANFSGNNGSHFFIELFYDLLDQDSNDKTSTVKYYFYLGSTDGYSGSGSSAVNCYINGEWIGSTNSIGVNSYALIGTKEVVLYHDSEGKCNPGYSASASSNWTGISDASMSGSYELPQIIITPVETDQKIDFKVSGAWKKAISHLKVGGAYKKAALYKKINGVWKEGI